MCELRDGVERPCSDFIVLVFLFVEDWGSGGICEEVDEPIDEDEEPDEPKGDWLSHMSLELNFMRVTLE